MKQAENISSQAFGQLFSREQPVAERIVVDEERVEDAATDYFDALSRLDGSISVRNRYRVLGTVLVQAVDQKVKGVDIKFSGLFAKIEYLVKEYQVRKKDKSLSMAINDVRVRLREADITDDTTLESSFAIDLKAVARFIALVYGVVVPEALEARFPLTEYRHYRHRLTGADGHTVKALRCVIDSWDDEYVMVTREDTGEPARIRYAFQDKFTMGDWSYLRDLFVANEVLSVVKPREADGVIYPELLIFAPDCLVNVTTIAQCYDDTGASPLVALLEKIKPRTTTEPILLGNFAGQLLDEAAYGIDIEYADSIRDFFRRNALSFAACPQLSKDFHKEAQRQKQNIRHAISTNYRQKLHQDFRSDDIILEPSFFSPVLGLQGRMDFLGLDYRVVIEQKSGKGAFAPGCPPDKLAGAQVKHLVQLLLYRALLHYDYAQLDYSELYSFLLYSKYTDGLLDVTSMPKLLFEAIKLRNGIARCELACARGGMDILDELTPESFYPNAIGKLWTDYVRPQTEALLRPIHEASDLERAYYFRMLRFIAGEHLLSRLGNKTKENAGFAATWTSTVEEKRQAGNIYERLTIRIDHKADRIEQVAFRFNEQIDVDMTNFRVGDIVFFYPYHSGELPDATSTMVFRSTVTAITPTEVTVHLRNPQTSRVVFDHYQDSVWAIEHDFMDSSYSALYRSMHDFLSATPRRRDLLLGQRQPETDQTVGLRGDYARDGRAEFNDLVLHAKQARDLYLIIGPPGTGKTSYGMRNLLEEYLLEPDTSVLLLSYTNRAVDEICSKLVEIDGGRLDFIRLGHEFSCEENYRPYLFSNKAAQCRDVTEIRQMIHRTRVFCGTTTSLCSHIDLFQLKQFDLAIVDEASQILEPHIIGLLSARHGEEDAIRKFVLIGDEKQLPAVVQQTAEESQVKEEALRKIGLKDCRLSLFERLLHLYGYCDGQLDERCCHMLTRQGRMHPDIARFPNYAFYQNALRSVPLAHQREATPVVGPGRDGLEDLLVSRRVAFLSCRADGCPEESDKVNRVEARLIAALVKAEYDRLGDAFDARQSVGVIVPYRNQIATVRSAVAACGIAVLQDITIDTVERYQGSQRDMIVYGFTVKRYYQLGFLTSNEYVDETDGSVVDRKLNVAMTRARRNLVLVGNAALLSRDVTFYKLIAYVKGQQGYFDVSLDDVEAGRFEVPERSVLDEESMPDCRAVFSSGVAQAFEQWVTSLLRQDKRTEWPRRILGRPREVNLDLIGYGRGSFGKVRILFEHGRFRKVDLLEQVLLYCHYLMPLYAGRMRRLLEAHRERILADAHACGDKVCVVDCGCGPATAGVSFAAAFGSLLSINYVGIDVSADMRMMARRMMEAADCCQNLSTYASFSEIPSEYWTGLGSESALSVFLFSEFFSCITPAQAERLACRLVEKMRRGPQYRYLFVVSPDGTAPAFHTFRRIVSESGLPAGWLVA